MSKKVVVVGGGYGGTEVIRQLVLRGLRNIELELVSSKGHFENIIGGTEAISEKVKVEELVYDLRELSNYWNFELIVGDVKNINLNERTIEINGHKENYDILVVATGSEPNFYNVAGVNLVYPAYGLDNFKLINEKLKQLSPNNPSVAVVGAGFVGLEVVSEVLDLFSSLKRKVNITVVEKMNSVLPAYNNEQAKKMASEYFISRSVKFELGNGVKQLKEGKVILENGNQINSDLTIWTAGIKSSKIASNIVGASLYKGCVEVDERLLIKGREDAFAIGDVAFVKISGKEAQKMAGEALEQAKTVAKNIALVVNSEKPSIVHTVAYPTDFPKVLLSLGEGKAMLIFGPQYASIGSVEYFLKKRIDFDEMMGRFPL